MTTYIYGILPNQEIEGTDKVIICLSAQELLNCFVFMNAPASFTNSQALELLPSDFLEDLDENEPFDTDDEVYQYPSVVMRNTLPEGIQNIGHVETGRTDEWLVIPSEKEQELLDFIERSGDRCLRKDNIIKMINIFSENRADDKEFQAAVKDLKGYIN